MSCFEVTNINQMNMEVFGKEKGRRKESSCLRLQLRLSHVRNNRDNKRLLSRMEKGICCIKVLGSGCASCHAQLENAKEAVKNMGLSVEVEYVTDLQKIMEYGVMSMPALVVNEKVIAMGKVLKPADVEKLLHKLGF